MKQEFKELIKRPDIDQNKHLTNAFDQFGKFLTELKKKELSDELVVFINNGIEEINTVSDSEKELRKQIRKTQSGILKIIEMELKLVTKNHYRNKWMALGIAVFGIPLGVAFETSLGNMAFLALVCLLD